MLPDCVINQVVFRLAGHCETCRTSSNKAPLVCTIPLLLECLALLLHCPAENLTLGHATLLKMAPKTPTHRKVEW